MTDSFNTGGDQSSNPQSFSDQNSDDNQNSNTDGDNSTLTPEQLAALQKRDKHAQEHITNLEAETADLKTQMAEMQAKLDKAAQVEDLLNNQDQSNQPVDMDELTTKAVEKLQAQQDAKAAKELADSNFDKVSTALTEKYGEQTDEAVQKACEENDMTFQDMVALSKKNPKLAMKLCDVDVKPEQQATKPTINSSAVLDQFQGNQQPTKVNVMELRTDRERVEDYQRRLAEKLKTL